MLGQKAKEEAGKIKKKVTQHTDRSKRGGGGGGFFRGWHVGGAIGLCCYVGVTSGEVGTS